jgi:hypothetical protein
VTAAKKTTSSTARKTAASASKADAENIDTTQTTPADDTAKDAAAASENTSGSTEAAPLDAPGSDGNADADADNPGDADPGDADPGDADQGDNADGGSTAARSNAVEAGPQTGAAALPENTARPQATIVNETPGAAPLDPPADSHLQRQPSLGYSRSSTDQTYAAAGGRTIAGEDHVALVDSDGNPVDVSTLFYRENNRATHVIATKRVSEVHTTLGAKTTSKRLLFPEGARVPLAQALAIENAAKADAEAAASKSE